jgi:hypothetical protein
MNIELYACIPGNYSQYVVIQPREGMIWLYGKMCLEDGQIAELLLCGY